MGAIETHAKIITNEKELLTYQPTSLQLEVELSDLHHPGNVFFIICLLPHITLIISFVYLNLYIFAT